MAVTYSLKGDLARIAAQGKYEYDEARSRIMDALTDPRSPTPVAMLVDISQSESRRTPDELRELADLFGAHREKLGGHVAFVAAEPLQYGLARMLEIFSDSRAVTVRVFNDDDEALAWLRQPGTGNSE